MRIKLGHLFVTVIISSIFVSLPTSNKVYAGPKAQVGKNVIEVVEVKAHLSGIVEELEKAQIYIPQLHEHIRQLKEKLAIVDFKLTPKKIKPKSTLPSPTLSFGKYYALIIGNNEYIHWPKLDTPENDAKKTAEVLEKRYGFETKTLINATKFDILDELNELRKELTEKDNLLIYYAGHGHLEEKISRGYWVPVDGEIDSNAKWISTIDISDILNLMSVKHVILVSDSCYSGAFTRSALTRPKAGMSDEARLRWFKVMSGKRSRTVLTSGSLKPVLDGGGGGHSVFAKAFLSVLRENNEIFEGQHLYKEVSARVAYIASAVEVEQIPQYAPIRFAGHESGEFIFMPIIK
jgi:uncharacterized caspase-like protein